MDNQLATTQTSRLGELWSQAVKNYEVQTEQNVDKHKMTETIRDFFKHPNKLPDSAKIIADDIIRFQGLFKGKNDGDKKVRIVRYMVDVLEILGKLSSVIGDAASSVFSYAPAIASVVAHVLGSFAGTRDFIDTLDQLFDIFMVFFRRLTILDKVLPVYGTYTDLVSEVFVALLEYCTWLQKKKASRLFVTMTFVIVMIGRKDKELSAAYDGVFAAIANLDAATNMQTLAGTYGIQTQTSELVSQANVVLSTLDQQGQYLRQIDMVQRHAQYMIHRLYNGQTSASEEAGARSLQSQCIITYSLAPQTDALQRRFQALQHAYVPDTLLWLLEKPAYPDLLEWARTPSKKPSDDSSADSSKDSRVVRISGPPGTGKSMAVFRLHQQLLQDVQTIKQPVLVAAFFFNDMTDELRSLRNALACCSAQLFDGNENYRENVRVTIQGGRKGGNNQTQATRWQDDLLKSLFTDQFDLEIQKDRLPGKLILLFDGIDCLATEERDALLKAVTDTGLTKVQIYFVLSGREESFKNMDPIENNSKNISISRQDILKDFDLVAKASVKKSPNLWSQSTEVQECNVKRVVSNADSFTYVQHVINRLGTTSSSQMMTEILDSIDASKESNKTIYDTILSDCASSYTEADKDHLRRLFVWLAFAEGRTMLPVAQLYIEHVFEFKLEISREVTVGRLAQILTLSDNICNGKNTGIILEFQGYLRDHFRLAKHPNVEDLRINCKLAPLLLLGDVTGILTSEKARQDQLTDTHAELLRQAARSWGPLMRKINTDVVESHVNEELADGKQSFRKALAASLTKLKALFENNAAIENLQRLADVDGNMLVYSIFGATQTECEMSLDRLIKLGALANLTDASEETKGWVSEHLGNRNTILQLSATCHAKICHDSKHPRVAFAAFQHTRHAQRLMDNGAAGLLFSDSEKFDKDKDLEKTRADFPGEDWKWKRAFAMALSFNNQDEAAFEVLNEWLLANPQREETELSKEDNPKRENPKLSEEDYFYFQYRRSRAWFALWYQGHKPNAEPFVDALDVILGKPFLEQKAEQKAKTSGYDTATCHAINSALQMQALIYAREGTFDLLLKTMHQVFWKESSKYDFRLRFFDDLIAKLGEKKEWNLLIELLTYLNKKENKKLLADQLFSKETQTIMARAAMATEKHNVVQDFYESKKEPESNYKSKKETESNYKSKKETESNYKSKKETESNGNGDDENPDRQVARALFGTMVSTTSKLDKQKELLEEALRCPTAGLMTITTAGQQLADIIMSDFMGSQDAKKKKDALEYAKKEQALLEDAKKKQDALDALVGLQATMTKHLGLAFQPAQSSFSTPLAIMRRKLGPAGDYYAGMNATFKACCAMLRDDRHSNDAQALRRLAKALAVIGLHDFAQEALSCQRYMLPVMEPEPSRDSGTSPPLPKKKPKSDNSAEESRKRSRRERGSSEPHQTQSSTVSRSDASGRTETGDINSSWQVSCALCAEVFKEYTKQLRLCYYCADVHLCNGCWKLRTTTNAMKDAVINVCSKDHQWITFPVDDWIGVKNGELLRTGRKKETRKKENFHIWLGRVEASWQKYWEDYWQ